MIKIRCKKCGCEKEIAEKQNVKGDCIFCGKDFGFYLISPEAKLDWGIDNPEILKHTPLQFGDIVTINTELSIFSKNRIHSLERQGVILYQVKE